MRGSATRSDPCAPLGSARIARSRADHEGQLGSGSFRPRRSPAGRRQQAATAEVTGSRCRGEAARGAGRDGLIEHLPAAWPALVVAALLVGFAKTAIGGVGVVAVALVAGVMPARESTAAVLLLLLVGDVLAVAVYRRHCDWALLRSLVPGILPGLLLGTVTLAVLSDRSIRLVMGSTLLLLVLTQLIVSRRVASSDDLAWSGRARVGAGAAAGFTTMVANAGGPVMTLYLVAQGVDKHRFLGTSAWFFLGVNVSKLPFSVGLGLVHQDMLTTTALLAPAVLAGGLLGVVTVRRVRQRAFDLVVLGGSALSAVALVVPLL